MPVKRLGTHLVAVHLRSLILFQRPHPLLLSTLVLWLFLPLNFPGPSRPWVLTDPVSQDLGDTLGQPRQPCLTEAGG